MRTLTVGEEFSCVYNDKARECVVERLEGSVVRVRILPSTPELNSDERLKAEQGKLFRCFLFSGIRFTN